MTFKEICVHERLGIKTRKLFGYGQHDDHLWRWLNYHLALQHRERRIWISTLQTK